MAGAEASVGQDGGAMGGRHFAGGSAGGGQFAASNGGLGVWWEGGRARCAAARQCGAHGRAVEKAGGLLVGAFVPKTPLSPAAQPKLQKHAAEK